MPHEPVQVYLRARHVRHAHKLVIGHVAGCAGIGAANIQRFDTLALARCTVPGVAPDRVSRVTLAYADNSDLAVFAVRAFSDFAHGRSLCARSALVMR